MTNTTKVVLVEPIQFGTEKIIELEIRKPKAKDFRKMPMNPTFGDMLTLLSALTGREPPVLDELGVEDLMKVSEVVAGFIPGGLATGGKV